MSMQGRRPMTACKRHVAAALLLLCSASSAFAAGSFPEAVSHSKNSERDFAPLTLQCAAGETPLDLREYFANEPLTQVTYLPQATSDANKIHVLALTGDKDILRSTDTGKTWVNIGPHMPSVSFPSLGVRFTQVSVAAASGDVFVFGEGSGKSHIWRSSDGGMNWQHVDLTFLSDRPFLVDETGNLLALRSFPANCSSELFSPNPCYLELLHSHSSSTVSGSFGQFHSVDTYVSEFTWGISGEIWYTAFADKTGNYQTKLTRPQLFKIAGATNLGAKSKVLDDIVHVVVDYGRVWAFQEPTPAVGQLAAMALWVGSADGTTSDFVKATFPSVYGDIDHIEVLKATKDMIAVHVRHRNVRTSSDYDYGNLYVSSAVPNSASGNYEFTLSVKHNKILASAEGDRYEVEFTSLGRLTSNHIANRVMPPQLDGTPEQQRTIITFDGGAQWHFVEPPAGSDLKYPCDFLESVGTVTMSPCQSLHLHGAHKLESGDRIVSSFDFAGPLYASDAAVGLVMATGNVGYEMDMTDQHVYMSRDGGVTWAVVEDGSMDYAFADHGAVVLAASTSGTTNTISYSFSQGTSPFQECRFTNRGALKVVGIIPDPSPTARSFLLIGINETSNAGVLVHVDFSNTLTSTCTESDFEQWPKNDSTVKCFGGTQLSFWRRKASARCWNTNSMEKLLTSVPCRCGSDDFMCAACYTETIDGRCVHVDEDCDQEKTLLDAGVCSEHNSLGYFETGPYQKVPGNLCQGGAEAAYAPNQIPCPSPSGSPPVDSASTSHHSGSGTLAAAIVIPVLLLTVIALVALYFKNTAFREKIQHWASATSRRGGGKYGNVHFQPLQNDDDDDDDMFGGGPEILDDDTLASRSGSGRPLSLDDDV